MKKSVQSNGLIILLLNLNLRRSTTVARCLSNTTMRAPHLDCRPHIRVMFHCVISKRHSCALTLSIGYLTRTVPTFTVFGKLLHSVSSYVLPHSFDETVTENTAHITHDLYLLLWCRATTLSFSHEFLRSIPPRHLDVID